MIKPSFSCIFLELHAIKYWPVIISYLFWNPMCVKNLVQLWNNLWCFGCWKDFSFWETGTFVNQQQEKNYCATELLKSILSFGMGLLIIDLVAGVHIFMLWHWCLTRYTWLNTVFYVSVNLRETNFWFQTWLHFLTSLVTFMC